VPDFVGGFCGRGGFAWHLVLRIGVIVHAQLFEIDDAAVLALTNHICLEPVTLPPVVSGLDHFRVTRGISGVGRRRGRGVRAGVRASADSNEIGAGDDANCDHESDRA